ncbi:hypothetical protein V5F38_05185 [Xanthobacter sp. V0B-10]|uniref:hypothetical protein n=1 Tax=Xanthobacter albus TaxID=3119929 RepID=UPI00372A46CA
MSEYMNPTILLSAGTAFGIIIGLSIDNFWKNPNYPVAALTALVTAVLLSIHIMDNANNPETNSKFSEFLLTKREHIFMIFGGIAFAFFAFTFIFSEEFNNADFQTKAIFYAAFMSAIGSAITALIVSTLTWRGVRAQIISMERLHKEKTTELDGMS